MRSVDLLVSVVIYDPDLEILTACLNSLADSLDLAREQGGLSKAGIVLVDNGPEDNASHIQSIWNPLKGGRDFIDFRLISQQGNTGFGAGHNLAARSYDSRYYLVLNPDVILEPEALFNAMSFMEKRQEIGLLSPLAHDGHGRRQFLCKQFPAVLDLGIRGFAPAEIKKMLFAERLARYEMREPCAGGVFVGVPIVSGCFMFLRRTAWDRCGGFDPGFFLYFEDFDLSLRIGKEFLIAYVPTVRIIHFGGHAARKGWKHVSMFLKSALRFYRIHGLRIW